MENISNQYANFLKSNLAFEEGDRFATALLHHGFQFEATLLKAYLRGEKMIHLENEWTNSPIPIGKIPPNDHEIGECWFDIVQMQLCIYIPNDPDWDIRTGGWFSTHPVQNWQYLGFIKSAQIQWKSTPRFPLLEEASIKGLEKEPATGIYAYEAKIYCAFFNKSLLADNFHCAKAYLSEKLLHQMAPPNLNFWDYDFAYGREDLPMAFNLENVASEDLFELMEAENIPDEKKLVYDEWERSPFVGFSTYLPVTRNEYLKSGEVYPFVAAMNRPARG